MMEDIRVLELYSGIGGMHYALQRSLRNAKVVAAVDISPIANEVYRHNFKNTQVIERGIEGFSVKQLNKLKFNVVLMSPPCQPFTRIGLQKDISDPRTKSFLHFMSLLPKLAKLPSYVLLENVKGFETSESYKRLCSVLDECKYHQQGFLLSPKHIGIPNARQRFYMLAKIPEFHRQVKNVEKIWKCLPIPTKSLRSAEKGSRWRISTTVSLEDNIPPATKKAKFEENTNMSQFGGTEPTKEAKTHSTIKDYLEESPSEEYEVPKPVKDRYIGVMDIVRPDSTNSTCFTKSYTQYAEGTGSILDMAETETVHRKESKDRNPGDFELRYFTPREVANLLGFPAEFSFPDHVTRKQCYRVLGNSLNVNIVSYLLMILFLEDERA